MIDLGLGRAGRWRRPPAIGFLAHSVFGLPTAVAFALGAIVAPTDAVAAPAILRRLGVPAADGQRARGREPGQRRDRAGRLQGRGRGGGRRQLLRLAEAGLDSSTSRPAGSRSGSPSAGSWPRSASASTTRPTEVTISLFTGYAAFLPADELGLSGVLADGHRRPLPRLAGAGTGLAGNPAADLLALVDPHLPPQRDPLRPDRAAAAGDRRRHRRQRHLDADRRSATRRSPAPP